MSCPICFDSVITGDSPSHIARCGHCLHLKCWQECLRNSTTGIGACPVCRKSTTLQQLVRVYLNFDEEGDVGTPFTKRINSLLAQIKTLEEKQKTTASDVSSQQNMNASLRAEIEKTGARLAVADRELQDLRDQLRKDSWDREQLYLFRKRFQEQLESARLSGDNKRDMLRKLLALTRDEVGKLSSEIQSPKSGKTTQLTVTRSNKLRIRINKLMERVTSLNEQLI